MACLSEYFVFNGLSSGSKSLNCSGLWSCQVSSSTTEFGLRFLALVSIEIHFSCALPVSSLCKVAIYFTIYCEWTKKPHHSYFNGFEDRKYFSESGKKKANLANPLKSNQIICECERKQLEIKSNSTKTWRNFSHMMEQITYDTVETHILIIKQVVIWR